MKKLILVFLILASISFAQTRVNFAYNASGEAYASGTATIAIGATSTTILISKDFSREHQGYAYLSVKATGDTIITNSFRNYWGASVGSDPSYVSLGALADDPAATTASYDIGKLTTYFRNNDGLDIKFSIPAARLIAQTIVWRVKIR